MKGIDEKWLKERGLKLQKDGTYKKDSNTSEAAKKNKVKQTSMFSTESNGDIEASSVQERIYDEKNDIPYRSIEIRLFGKPMPKQSVKLGKFGAYQPKKYHDRTKDYIDQINKQLPEDFEMFTEDVILEEFTVIFPPLKGFSKKKMDLIKEGWLFKKTTRPDLPDNLKKLPLDSMADLVFKDDALIWQECNTTKVFGTGGCIIIKMKGR